MSFFICALYTQHRFWVIWNMLKDVHFFYRGSSYRHPVYHVPYPLLCLCRLPCMSHSCQLWIAYLDCHIQVANSALGKPVQTVGNWVPRFLIDNYTLAIYSIWRQIAFFAKGGGVCCRRCEGGALRPTCDRKERDGGRGTPHGGDGVGDGGPAMTDRRSAGWSAALGGGGVKFVWLDSKLLPGGLTTYFSDDEVSFRIPSPPFLIGGGGEGEEETGGGDAAE